MMEGQLCFYLPLFNKRGWNFMKGAFGKVELPKIVHFFSNGDFSWGFMWEEGTFFSGFLADCKLFYFRHSLNRIMYPKKAVLT